MRTIPAGNLEDFGESEVSALFVGDPVSKSPGHEQWLGHEVAEQRVKADTRMTKPHLEHFARILREREGQLRRQIDAARQRTASERFTEVASEAPDLEDAAFAGVIDGLNNAEVGRGLEDLRSVRDALLRIEVGSYGVCQRCGEPIPADRLEAFPTARCDVEHQKDAERQAAGTAIHKRTPITATAELRRT